MRNILKYISAALLSLLLSACIENDISYPKVVIDFTSFEVEGQKSLTIDTENRVIEIVMKEDADMDRVKVLGWSVTDGGSVVGGMPEYLDLNYEQTFTLTLYEDFIWTVKGSQPVERYIRCDNQVGDAVFDLEERTAYVYVTEDQQLHDVKFNEMKLEPEGSVIRSTKGFIYQNGSSVPLTQECRFPMVLDCVITRYFYVDYDGREIRWSVVVLQKAVELELSSVNAWAYSAGLKGITNGKGTPVLEYRKAADGEWATFSDLNVEGSSVSVVLNGLEPGQEYVARLNNGELISPEKTFTTGSAVQLENLNFDSWTKDNKYPNAAGYNVWDSANSSGATITTSPTTDAVKNNAAKLESKKAMGLLAAGNIFTGSFVSIAFGQSGAGAKLNWGTPFTGRPLALRGYYKYSPKAIDMAGGRYADMKGKTDQCQILISLSDWKSPFLVNTSTSEFVDFDNDPGIIAFGQFNTDRPSSEYVKFTLPLVYRDNSRIPSYIIIAGASSRYGDYFTGGVGSELFIDEFELVYDPAELTKEEYAAVFSKVQPF